MNPSIECTACGTAHEPTPIEGGFGFGCACEVADGVLQGHYGSAIADMTAYRVTGNAPVEGGPYCDSCVTRWIATGAIVELDDQGTTDKDDVPDAVQAALSNK